MPMRIFCGAMGESALRRHARRIAKGIWWIATPWRMPQRIGFIRLRAAAEARAAETAALIEQQRGQTELRESGVDVLLKPFNLFDDASVINACALPRQVIFWPPVRVEAVVDRWTAARFFIDLWRSRPDLRERFPAALTGGRRGDFGLWLAGEGVSEFKLSADGVRHVLEALDACISERARQAFLADLAICGSLPHGLTPAGMRDLFRWFMRCALIDKELRIEEVWWLFLQAAEDPERELSLAYCFTPAWQRLHPEGATRFGRLAFASWFARRYGASGLWVNATAWSDWQAPAIQLRIAHAARAAWRRAHPAAFLDIGTATAFVSWLSTEDAGLPEEARRWCSTLSVASICNALIRPGFNIIGHFCYPSGLRVSAESLVESASSAGLSIGLRDVCTDAKDDPHHVDFRDLEFQDVTIIHTQPEPFFREAYSRANLAERSPRTYRVAYWYWEFDSIPDEWVAHVREIDEVWAATEFVAKGLRAKLSIPVRTLFPGVKLAPFERRAKGFFKLPESHFTFLFTFHMMSVMERKNPLGLIRAFKMAFNQNDAVNLVLKTSFGDRHPAQLKELCEAAANANITVIDQVFSPDQVLSLMDCCDAYVSLHRSEGLGLTMAEAMLMGKPVIATNFSGNVDFMSRENSLLVDYELVKLGKPIPPYSSDLEWAEPSIDHAAKLLRQVFENQVWAREVGLRGKSSAEENLSVYSAGRRIAKRLKEIQEERIKESVEMESPRWSRE